LVIISYNYFKSKFYIFSVVIIILDIPITQISLSPRPWNLQQQNAKPNQQFGFYR